MDDVTVLLAEDHAVVREGLRALLSAEPGLKVVAEASNGHQAVRLAREIRPQVIVMDIVMPSLNGLEATRQIRRELPSARILVLSSYSDDGCVKQSLEAGVAGYLIKQTAAEDLITAIREVAKGNAFFSPAIARRLRDQSRTALGGRAGATGPGGLTPRETQVLQLISRGFANKQMAAELGISVKTIEKHRQHMMKKLNIHDIAGLTRYAVAKGILSLGSPIQEPTGGGTRPEHTSPIGAGPTNQDEHSTAA